MCFFLKYILETAMRGKITDPKNVNEIIFMPSAESRDQEYRCTLKVEKAGGTNISEPEEFGEGYYGFIFADQTGTNPMYSSNFPGNQT